MRSLMSPLPPQLLNPMSHVTLYQSYAVKKPVNHYKEKLECPPHSQVPVQVACLARNAKEPLTRTCTLHPFRQSALNNRELATLTMIEVKGVRTVFWWTQKADE